MLEINIDYATETDFVWLKENDIHVVNDAWIKRCLAHNEYLVARRQDSTNIGFLRFSYFWGNIPYMDMIRINEENQKTGVGTQLVRFWEKKMKSNGAALCMTSSLENEPEPLNWHKRNGYIPTGQIHFKSIDQYPEIFLIKEL